MHLNHPLLQGPKRIHGKTAVLPTPKLVRVTAQMLEDMQTAKGGYTRAALEAMGVSWPPPKGWKKKLIGQLRIVEEVAAPTPEPIPATAPQHRGNLSGFARCTCPEPDSPAFDKYVHGTYAPPRTTTRTIP